MYIEIYKVFNTGCIGPNGARTRVAVFSDLLLTYMKSSFTEPRMLLYIYIYIYISTLNRDNYISILVIRIIIIRILLQAAYTLQ